MAYTWQATTVPPAVETTVLCLCYFLVMVVMLLSLSLYCQGLQWHTKNMLALVIVAIGVVPALAGELHPSVCSSYMSC